MQIRKSCLIISGGEYAPLPEIFPDPDYVIACDRGYVYAERMGIRPDIVMGDFDSSPFPAGMDSSIPVLRFPCRKDDTDTMLAVHHALEQGCGEITICCAFGGRLDHTIANLQAAAFIASEGRQASLLGKDSEAAVIANGERAFPSKDGWSLSLFALSDECRGVSIRGTGYDCENIIVTNHYPLGVSNYWSRDTARISVESGILLVISSRLED